MGKTHRSHAGRQALTCQVRHSGSLRPKTSARARQSSCELQPNIIPEHIRCFLLPPAKIRNIFRLIRGDNNRWWSEQVLVIPTHVEELSPLELVSTHGSELTPMLLEKFPCFKPRVTPRLSDLSSLWKWSSHFLKRFLSLCTHFA